MRRKIITICVMILLVIACSYTACAEELDYDQLGSITITLAEQKEPVVGAQLSVYHVATVEINEDGKLFYDYTKEFRQLENDIDDSVLVTTLDAFVTQNTIPSIGMTTDAKGTAFCGELPLGLYFIKQTGGVEGFAPCAPFIVTIPNKIDGEYVYDVDASPKTEVERLTDITIKKVWNIENSAKKTESVTVQLLKNGNVIKTATLSEDNNWQVTYTDMPASDAYSIKETDVPKGFTATYQQKGCVFTVTNTSTLAQSGQLIWPIPVLAVSGMLLIAAGVVLLRKKRKTNA